MKQQVFNVRRPVAGFSLIELLVTMAIVAILTAIAYPSYQNYVVRTHRAAAKACMGQYSQFMERYYTTNLTYVGAAPTLGCATEEDLNTRYTMSVGNLAQGTYTVRATPVGAQLARDTQCGTVTTNQLGVHTASGSGGVAYCW
jgi:type IV pilus assembly protein PilE